MRAGAAAAGSLAPEPAVVPLGFVVCDQCELRSEHPPIAVECQVAARHVVDADVLSLGDLADVLIESRAKRPFGSGSLCRCLADVDEFTAVVERVNAAVLGPYTCGQRLHRARLKLLDSLLSDPAIEVKLEVMGFLILNGHDPAILANQRAL